MIHAPAEKMKKTRKEHPNARPVGAWEAIAFLIMPGLAAWGVETDPKVYVVLWDSQGNNTEPSGELAILSGAHAGNPKIIFVGCGRTIPARRHAALAACGRGGAGGFALRPHERDEHCQRAVRNYDGHRKQPERL